MVSVLIITYNEEINLPGCLDSVAWSDDVVVLDSHSTDRTVEIAKERGARVFQRRFDDFGSQREAARTEVDYRHEWVLAVDADERPDEHLVREIGRVAAAGPGGPDAYRMRRKDHFMGRWIKRSTLYPSWFVRLYRHGKVRYERRSVHEYPVVEGPIGELQGHLLHHGFNKGLSEWMAKHNRYAALEARENLKVLSSGRMDWTGLLALTSPVRRRRALKELSMRLPFRAPLRFLYMYVLRGGFLDGVAGLTYCRLIAFYEYLIVLNMKEIRRRDRGLPV